MRLLTRPELWLTAASVIFVGYELLTPGTHYDGLWLLAVLPAVIGIALTILHTEPAESDDK